MEKLTENEIIKERGEGKCKNCSARKYYAKAFDMHFDKKDCTCECQEEIETLRNILAHKEAEVERLENILREIAGD